jgi:glycosyltransferase involved in cell wall biosynthesis
MAWKYRKLVWNLNNAVDALCGTTATDEARELVRRAWAEGDAGPLLTAFEALAARPEYQDLKLVLAGPVQTGGEDVLNLAREGSASDRIVLPGFVDDVVLPPLYAGATAFCFTGKGEGFGLPILEAMACGCPVVVARAGANVSTAAHAALLVDPDDADDLAQALVRVLEDAALRADLVRRGIDHAEEYSWRKTARRTLAAYRDSAHAVAGAPA